MKISSIIKICLVVIILFLSSCMCLYDYHCCLCGYKTNKISYRDSVAFDYAIKYVVKNGLILTLNWKNYYFQNTCNFYFLNMYQSPDSLKSVIIMVARLPDKPDSSDNNFSLHGKILFGIRNSKNDLWELFPSNSYSIYGYKKIEDLLCLLESFLHSDIKKVCYRIANPKMTKEQVLSRKDPWEDRYIMAYNQYTIEDPEFWTESIYFKKGLRAKGYYLFQTYNHIPDEDQIMDYKIEYPDSILKMYGKTKSGSK